MVQGVPSISLSQSPIVMLYEVSTWICRIITTRWQETAMVAGVACAVIGAVVAFFQGMPLLACAFLFFGAINAAGLTFMQQINAIRTLEREILGSMQKENDKLKASNNALEKTKAELETTTGELKQTKSELEETVQQLKVENAKQKSDFDESNQKLSAQIIELTTAVAILSGLGEGLKDEVEKSVENTKVAEKILSKIQLHANQAQLVLEQIKVQFKTQDQTFNQRIGELKMFFSDANVQKCIDQLVTTLHAINAHHVEHNKLLHEYAQFKEAFGRESALLEVVRKNLESVHQQLQRDERGIHAGVQMFTDQIKELRQGLDGLKSLNSKEFLPSCHLRTASSQ